MKKILWVVLLLMIALLSVLPFFLTFVCKSLKDEPLANYAQTKAFSLLCDRPGTRIIVAGDSRAQRQINPLILEQKTRLSTVNIACEGCDLVTTACVLRKFPEVLQAGDRMLLLSATIFQLNDGAIDGGYLSTASFAHFSLRDQIKLCWKNPYTLLCEYQECYRNFVKIKVNKRVFDCSHRGILSKSQMETKGFLGVEGKWDGKTGKFPPDKYPWYKNCNIHGLRWMQFASELQRLCATGNRIVLFRPPISPTWRSLSRGRVAEKSEGEFGKKLAALGKTMHFRLIDFYQDSSSFPSDTFFYDPTHLNLQGANHFSELIADSLLSY